MTKQNSMTLPATGERFLTEHKDESAAEHLHRYSIALALCDGKAVLDIAAGEGYGSNLLASVAKSVVGIDIARDAIEHASTKYQRANLRFIHGSASHIPIDSSSIDVAVSFETLEHHLEHEAMLSELRRVLRPDGLLIISTPEKLNYTDRRHIKNPYHVKELYLEEFRELVARHFDKISLYFQQMAYGSVVFPENAIGGLEFVQGNFEGVTRAATLPMPLYNICIASNSSPPALPISVFGTGVEWSHAVREKQERIKLLEERVHNISATLQNLEYSTSFRIGRALTAPFRWFSGLNSSK